MALAEPTRPGAFVGNHLLTRPHDSTGRRQDFALVSPASAQPEPYDRVLNRSKRLTNGAKPVEQLGAMSTARGDEGTRAVLGRAKPTAATSPSRPRGAQGASAMCAPGRNTSRLGRIALREIWGLLRIVLRHDQRPTGLYGPVASLLRM